MGEGGCMYVCNNQIIHTYVHRLGFVYVEFGLNRRSSAGFLRTVSKHLLTFYNPKQLSYQC